MKRIVLILDAMGVLYQSADDVAELLIPFVKENGGASEPEAIEREYLDASLGRINAATFWKNVAVSPALEDTYLARHRLAADLPLFLQDLPETVNSLWCLSNDVSEWSRKLRTRYGLTNQFSGFVISGDVGIRKPSPEIYQCALDRIGRSAAECTFVDDRARNLDAARTLGFQTLLFDRGFVQQTSGHRVVQSFADLACRLRNPS